MKALDHLASLLRQAASEGTWELSPSNSIDKLLSDMEARSRGRKPGQLAEDQQLAAVRRFWDSQEVASFRDAYLLSWSLSLPHRPQGACIMEESHRLQRVLDGVDDWLDRPKAYRRCYLGLVTNYFTYDAMREGVAPAVVRNWQRLREYLYERNQRIRDDRFNPEWVDTAIDNRQLFTKQPYEPYVDALLRGDSGVIHHLCVQLGINQASWFLRELILAQVKGATRLSDDQFQALLSRLLGLLAANEVLRDRGMIAVLDRYARIAGTPLHPDLRDHAVRWWGNPWLPSNRTRWGGVEPATRAMVADWLKLEFIETFFTKLAEDGLGDPRRMNFWKRYVKSIEHIEFALGSTARYSRDPDLVELRKKMVGLIRKLDVSGANNAFIMHMGPFVAVEFSGKGNAFYGYARKSVPFDITQPLRLEVDGHNSLKHSAQAIIRLSHKDGIHNWDKWEPMFEATLRKEFRIAPSATAPEYGRTTRPRTAAPSPASDAHRVVAAPGAYSRAALTTFARENGLTIDDKTTNGGNLWVRVDGTDEVVTRVLTQWGFRNRPGKGWWR